MTRLRVRLRTRSRSCNDRGFTLTEMLVTTLLLVLASGLLATGIPIASNTYVNTVKSSNAQVALSTTATNLRSELGLANSVIVDGADDSAKVYYRDGSGPWVSIGNSSDFRGLEKQYYMGDVGLDNDVSELVASGSAEPLVSDSAITDDLELSFESVSQSSGTVTYANLEVTDDAGNTLASIDSYEVLTRFSS